MANIYKQTVSQEANLDQPKRFIVQYYDDVEQKDKNQVVNYDSLSAEEKTTYDAFQTLAESKMV